MNPNDPDVINLSKAIFQRESGGDFNAVGDAGTSHGAGQWQPGTWKAQAKDVLGDENAQMTPANQKAVIQVTVAKDKAAGLNPAQIAAKWNSGKTEGWENHVGTTTINGQQIHYDTPKYVKDVTELYHSYKGQGGGGSQAYNPTPYSTSAPGQFDFTGDKTDVPEAEKDTTLGGKLRQRSQDASIALGKTSSGEINPISGVLQTLGAGAGAVGDTVGSALELIPGVKQVEGLIGKGAGALAKTTPGQIAVSEAQRFSKEHPELSADIGAVGNIASVLPMGKAAGVIKDAAGAGIGKALGKDALESTIQAVSPELKGKAAVSAAKGGLIKKPFTGEIAAKTTDETRQVAETVAQHIPKFDKLGTSAEKLNAVHDTVYRLADKLKKEVVDSGSDRIYSFKELNSALRDIEKPIAIKADPVLDRQFDLARDAAIKIAQEKGGTVSSLFDARKEFDQLVSKQFPNLYDRANAPMRDAITSIRNGMNRFIDERLPEGSGFREKLLEQSRLFQAIDNLAPKAAQEIGTKTFERVAGRHPIISGILKGGAKAGVEGAGLGAVSNVI